MRYFGTLDEDEWAANLSGEYKFGERSKVQAGFTYKDKTRDYSASRFYYNLNKIDPEITDIFTPSDYLNQDNINQGLVSIERQKLKKDTYDAGNRIYAGYLLTDFYPNENWLINLGYATR